MFGLDDLEILFVGSQTLSYQDPHHAHLYARQLGTATSELPSPSPQPMLGRIKAASREKGVSSGLSGAR